MDDPLPHSPLDFVILRGPGAGREVSSSDPVANLMASARGLRRRAQELRTQGDCLGSFPPLKWLRRRKLRQEAQELEAKAASEEAAAQDLIHHRNSRQQGPGEVVVGAETLDRMRKERARRRFAEAQEAPSPDKGDDSGSR